MLLLLENLLYISIPYRINNYCRVGRLTCGSQLSAANILPYRRIMSEVPYKENWTRNPQDRPKFCLLSF